MSTSRPVVSQRTLQALSWEVDNIRRFLDRFEAPPEGARRVVQLGDTGEFIVVRHFPLPEGFRPDHVDLLVLVPDFPATPPIGLYCLNRNNESVIAQIETVFNAFRDRALHSAPSVPGYTWICHHYAENRWRYVSRAPSRGDNVAKFLSDFFFKLAE